MKKPRIADFDPDAKIPVLKSPLDSMPVIVKPDAKPPLDTHDIHGGSAFFPSYNGKAKEKERAKSSTPRTGSTPSTIVRDVRVVPSVPLVPPKKRIMKQRHPFDIYQDQYEALLDLARDERKQGGIGSMSAMVRQALDSLISEKRSEKK